MPSATPDLTPPDDLTLDDLAPRLIDAVLPHVPFDGWTPQALARAADDLGIPADRAALVFPGGAIDMIAGFIARADADMADTLDPATLASLKIRARIRLCITTRLAQAAPHREAIRRALAVLALPANAMRGARLLWRTADTMWRLAGDTATDFNHYTKRLTLGGVYAATLAVWLDDESDDQAETLAFLDRRLDGIIRFETFKYRLRESQARLPSLSRFLGRLRYPAS